MDGNQRYYGPTYQIDQNHLFGVVKLKNVDTTNNLYIMYRWKREHM